MAIFCQKKISPRGLIQGFTVYKKLTSEKKQLTKNKRSDCNTRDVITKKILYLVRFLDLNIFFNVFFYINKQNNSSGVGGS